jgi:hypothetical protein
MLPPIVRRYVFNTLAGTPEVLDALVRGIGPEDPVWDARPEADRFTLREIIAHLADWNPIFLGRMKRTCEEAEPVLESIDEGALAVGHDYAHADPRECLARFRQGRATLVEFLRSLSEDALARIAHRPTIGAVTVETQAVFASGHDGYHLQQVAQWLAASKR